MKELTIEEKAKRYDKVVEKAKIEKEESRNLGLLEFIDENFPELAESQDEKIRKELIEFVKSRGGFKQEYIAWLEIQGEHANFRNKIQIGDKVTRNEDGILVNLSQLNRVAKKQDEQKSADKVEPKFKIGDFVKHSAYSNDVYKIVSTNSDGSYELESVDGVCGKNIMAASEEYLSLWTIQDAKDGDVLCSNQIIILFKQWEDNTDYSFVIAHAGIDISGKLQITNGHWLISNKSKPATKEQRDLLFQKMKEAGYEWDAEHKQLKKIEQKPAEWSEEDDNTLLDTINILRSCGKCSTDRKLWLLSLKDRIQPQSKQEWSEEDEHYLFLCSQILRQYNTSTTIDSEVLINWIKSLKEKKYTWKPSYVQMEVLLSEVTALTEGCNKQIVLKSLYNDLMKLKGLKL